MIEKTGIPTQEDLERISPCKDRFRKGGCAVLECFQEIPCDPCVDACPRGAIRIEGNINNIPVLDFDKCNGCGLCVSRCPGIAIFVVNWNYSEKEGLVMIPYEFLPLPKKGDIVDGLDRTGRKVCDARVVRVLNREAQDRTAIISLAVPKEYVMRVRNIRMRKSR
ncbi:4Fe-4S ferredoxin [candidate division TA06 bacterium DG_26]|uniref:4Fe-4S ferredoxin n=1 Tax=candidate division TA06 bacterium DG_26 TaxID=1703771 RepID=A0A0S7WHP7_UNCT6|nr:MAG: 4Fe-4S ferredoxin [candidate division TA06 bacterium DG_26]